MTSDLLKVSRARRLGVTGEGRRLRRAASVSLRELAAAIDVDPATLTRWERGLTVPRAGAAVRWVDLLVELHAESRTIDG